MLTDPQRTRLAAVFDRIIPEDDWPAVSASALFPYLDRLGHDPGGDAAVADIVARCDAVIAAAGSTEPAALDAAIAVLDWADRDVLVQAAARAYYGDRDGPGAGMVGFRAGGSRPPDGPTDEPPLTTVALPDVADGYDVVVVGAGAGGGVAACVLAEAGASVLVVERGRILPSSGVRDHLRNHRSFVHGLNTTEPAEARELVVDDGPPITVEAAHDPRWHNNAVVVGGGTRVYQGVAWRFLPQDFAMATTYGIPDGSSLADWPIGLADLVPHYEWVEHHLGVSGDPSPHAHAYAGLGPAGYPMPPLPTNPEAALLAASAGDLGLRVGPPPLLVNSRAHGGRSGCVRCGECVGFPCPVGAKNGTHNTMLPRALASGRAALVTGARAVRLHADRRDRVDAVTIADDVTGATRTITAGAVVVAAGAIETARLLLASRSDAWPDGIGNDRGLVGANLQGHGFVSVFGAVDTDVVDGDGPGVSIASLDTCHDNPGIVGGGVLSNELVKLPIVHWNWALPPDAARWGLAAKAVMRASYRRTAHLFAHVQEIPVAGNAVACADRVDGLGMPLVRMRGRIHPETVRVADHLSAVGTAWLEASGATRTWADTLDEEFSAGQHQAGTCRMGTDPATSVTDPEGRVHGFANLVVADASVHVTNGSVNPVLTIMALAHRTASRVAAR